MKWWQGCDDLHGGCQGHSWNHNSQNQLFQSDGAFCPQSGFSEAGASEDIACLSRQAFVSTKQIGQGHWTAGHPASIRGGVFFSVYVFVHKLFGDKNEGTWERREQRIRKVNKTQRQDLSFGLQTTVLLVMELCVEGRCSSSGWVSERVSSSSHNGMAACQSHILSN